MSACEYKHVRLVVLALAVVCLAVPTFGYYTNTTKEEWSDVASKVEANTASGDLVVLTDDYVTAPYEYYSEEEGVQQIALNDTASNETVRQMVAGHEKVFFVVSHAEEREVDRIRSVIADSHRTVDVWHWTGIDVYVYDRR